MNKKLFETLAIERIKESKVLLDNGLYNGAYYVAGYAIECALKACIVMQINQHEIPTKDFIQKFYVHDLNNLLKLAGLDQALRLQEYEPDPVVAVNWTVVKDWNEGSRYKVWSKAQSEELYKAISSGNGGILLWLQQYW